MLKLDTRTQIMAIMAVPCRHRSVQRMRAVFRQEKPSASLLIALHERQTVCIHSPRVYSYTDVAQSQEVTVFTDEQCFSDPSGLLARCNDIEDTEVDNDMATTKADVRRGVDTVEQSLARLPRILATIPADWWEQRRVLEQQWAGTHGLPVCPVR
ncbi:hypothetical protein J8273_8095 [Carpediemonas membranifera]|uniref:Uncharacterized protein n=1 Tax=Carpediemonas membranifera TaxID=201153 RepID=A0A8J6APV4_9EUKA|nr:hypothetical protein J8273_8095 [Carpediemonas membranifera]|eukprot:KAG9390058.1 hypothetical protein J8273_8095 [Carpediemonas membranifera]